MGYQVTLYLEAASGCHPPATYPASPSLGYTRHLEKVLSLTRHKTPSAITIYISHLSWSYFHLFGLGLALGLVEASSTNAELGENGEKDKQNPLFRE